MQASSPPSWVEQAKAQERSSSSHWRQLSPPTGTVLALVARGTCSRTGEVRLRDYRIREAVKVIQRIGARVATAKRATAAKSGL
jgi:hypothetical protein